MCNPIDHRISKYGSSTIKTYTFSLKGLRVFAKNIIHILEVSFMYFKITHAQADFLSLVNREGGKDEIL